MKIYFHHIGKTAGTSFRRYLIEQVGEANVSPMLRGVKYRDALRDYAQFIAIGGHIAVIPGDKLAANRVSFTLLRDPIDRVLSEYVFRHTVHLLGRTQTSHAVGDLDSWLDALSEDERLALNAQLDAIWAFGWDAPSLPTMQQKIAAAKQGLEGFDVVGLQDLFVESVALFAGRVGWTPPSGLSRENATPRRIVSAELSDSTLGRLRRYLEPDYEVYQHGLMVFGSQRRAILRVGATESVAVAKRADERSRISHAQSRLDGGSYADKLFVIDSDSQHEPIAKDAAERELTIARVEVRGLISGGPTLQVGETAMIEVRFCAHVPERRLTVGFSIRDHCDALVFGTNTRLLGDNLEVLPGEYAVSFQFRNDLGLGKYWVTLALHRGMSELEKSFQRLERAAEFEVTDMVTEYFEGRIRLHVETSIIAVSPPAQLTLTPSQGDEREGLWFLGKRNPALTDFAAQLSPQVKLKSMTRASDMLVELKVTNLGCEVWSAFGKRSVRVSYHWLDAQGVVVEFDGLRTTLSRDIAPGEILCLACFLRAPETAGEFELVWTLVQEEVAWFDERNTASRCECAVTVA